MSPRSVTLSRRLGEAGERGHVVMKHSAKQESTSRETFILSKIHLPSGRLLHPRDGSLRDLTET